MTAPNIVNVSVITARTTGLTLANTIENSILNNAANSSKIFKINTLNVSNSSSVNPASITLIYHTAASLGGTALPIASTVSVPASTVLNIIDKGTQYYMEENSSLGATAGTANLLTVTVSYEEIS